MCSRSMMGADALIALLNIFRSQRLKLATSIRFAFPYTPLHRPVGRSERKRRQALSVAFRDMHIY